jgi:hypothetical protein
MVTRVQRGVLPTRLPGGRRYEDSRRTPHHTPALVDCDRASGHLRGGDIMEGEHSMHDLRTAFAVALAVSSLSSIDGTANATNAATGMSTAADRLTLVDQVEFVFADASTAGTPRAGMVPAGTGADMRMRSIKAADGEARKDTAAGNTRGPGTVSRTRNSCVPHVPSCVLFSDAGL